MNSPSLWIPSPSPWIVYYACFQSFSILSCFRKSTLPNTHTHIYIYIYKLQEKQKSFHNVVKKHHQKFLTKSNRPEVFCKKGALKNFAKFTGKHLCWSLLFKKLNTSGCIFKTFFIEHLRWLFLADIKNPKFQNK